MEYSGLRATMQRGVFAPVYLLFGDEHYLLAELAQDILNHFAQQPGGDFNTDRFDGDNASLEQIVELAQSPPFMADKRLVFVKDLPQLRPAKGKGEESEEKAKSSEGLEKPLLKYLENPNPSTCLLFYQPSGVDKRRKIVKSIEKAGHLVDVKKLKPAGVAEWAQRRAKEMALPFDKEAMELLLARTSGNLGQIAMEMDKLYTFLGTPSPQRKVTLERVRRLVPATWEDNVFALTDALAAGNIGSAMSMARDLAINGQHPVYILYMVSRMVRQLLIARDIYGRGGGEREVAAELKTAPFFAQKIVSQCRKIEPLKLRRILSRLAQADEAVKTGTGDAMSELEACLLAFGPGA